MHEFHVVAESKQTVWKRPGGGATGRYINPL
jgi:hypothetical protein